MVTGNYPVLTVYLLALFKYYFVFVQTVLTSYSVQL